MNLNDPNVALVEVVVQALGKLRDRFVFVGGCAAGLLVTDMARPPVRATVDVDLIVEVVNRNNYYQLAKELRAIGFREDDGSAVICRWRVGEVKVDIMPTDEEILHFRNRWYKRAVERANRYVLPSGQEINLISPPLFVATKLDAFNDRGNGDYALSHDLEDIVTLVDGRPELVEEIKAADDDVRAFIMEEIDDLLATPAFVDALPGHFPGDEANQARVPS